MKAFSGAHTIMTRSALLSIIVKCLNKHKLFVLLIITLNVRDSYQKKKCFQDIASDIRAPSTQVVPLIGDISTLVNRPADQAALADGRAYFPQKL